MANSPRDRNPKRMQVARAVAQMFEGYGVTHLFYVASILEQSLVELEEVSSITRVHTHHEVAAAYMADGYARAGRRPGLCLSQAVGAMNLAAGLRDAWLTHSPVVAITGGHDPQHQFRNRYQEVDDQKVFDPVTKLNTRVDAVNRLPDFLRDAFRVATSGCPGPVHLRMLKHLGQFDLEDADVAPYVEERFRSLPPFRPCADQKSIGAALNALASAKRPVIVAGSGVRISNAEEQLRLFAEKYRIPVATSPRAKGVIPDGHPLSVGVVGTYPRRSATRVVNRADFVFFIGTRAGSMTTDFWRVPKPGVRAMRLDIDGEVLGQNYALEVELQGDAQVTLAQMLRGASVAEASWIETGQSEVRSWWRDHESALNSAAVPIRPERLCRELTRLLPTDALLVSDTGHSAMWTCGMVDLASAEQDYLVSGGHLGWGFPAAIGAKCARPDRPVVLFTGDSGILYHIGELETAVRWNINVVVVVNNNGAGSQAQPGFDIAYGKRSKARSRELWAFTERDFAAIAQSFGAMGIRVTNPKDLGPAIERGLSHKGPVVIDVVTDIEVFAPLAETPANV